MKSFAKTSVHSANHSTYLLRALKSAWIHTWPSADVLNLVFFFFMFLISNDFPIRNLPKCIISHFLFDSRTFSGRWGSKHFTTGFRGRRELKKNVKSNTCVDQISLLWSHSQQKAPYFQFYIVDQGIEFLNKSILAMFHYVTSNIGLISTQQQNKLLVPSFLFPLTFQLSTASTCKGFSLSLHVTIQV